MRCGARSITSLTRADPSTVHQVSLTSAAALRASANSRLVKKRGPASSSRPYSTHSQPRFVDASCCRRSPSSPVGST